MSKPRRMTINPAKLRAAIEMSLNGEAIDSTKMNAEEVAIFRLIMSGANDPFEGDGGTFRYDTKQYLAIMRPFDEEA